MHPEKTQKNGQLLFFGSVVLVVAVIGMLAYFAILFKNESADLSQKLSATIQERNELLAKNASTTVALNNASSTVTALASQLSLTSDQLATLKDNYTAEKQKNDSFESQIATITGTVNTLDKLSKTDKELLQKYSKIYFLNENYVPESLSDIPDKYVYSDEPVKQIHTKVLPFLEDMIDDALDDNVKLWVVSAYRSFGTQAALKAEYTQIYGSGANTFSADQGYSEHQLGTTVDLTTSNVGGALDGFDATPAYSWMLKNAYKYGFILSYPKSNGYYEFEPWHWRFVGKDLAKYLHDNGLYFYDVDQRTIDSYLVNIFDP